MKLGERAILMRLSIGLPGEARQDPKLSGQVKAEHSLGENAGKWVKAIYPTEALAPIKELDNEARAYHAEVTLPFDTGIGILPAGLIMEHRDKLKEFAGRREKIVQDHFLARYDEWVAWAEREHNGTFDPKLYPGREAIAKKFYFRTEPLPVPDAEHFTGAVTQLLGVDTESVDIRVKDAGLEAQRELMRRLIEPVKAMADKLSEQPKVKKDGTVASDIVFRDTLVTNLRAIAALAPKLNLSGDAAIDGFCQEIACLANNVTPKDLRDNKDVRAIAAEQAKALFAKLDAYKL